MTAVPLGQGAYRRLYAGAPEVRLLNRWLESNPANPREGTSIIARPGINPTVVIGSDTNLTRGLFYFPGIYNDVLWVITGSYLYTLDSSLTPTVISTALTGTNTPEMTWMVGPGYQNLFIVDNGLLYIVTQTFAHNTVTETPTGTNAGTTIQIGSQHYVWTNSTPANASGTSGSPWQLLTSTSGGPDPINALWQAMNANNPGSGNYSPNLVTPNPDASMSQPVFVSPNKVATITALVSGVAGNSIVTTVSGTTGISFSTSTLTGGVIVLQPIDMPGGQKVKSLTQVSGYVLVSVLGSQQFFWINPGEETVDALNFASKESSPDPIVSMRTVGDQVLIMGEKSTENWYATGNSAAPFAPIQGRVYARGVIDLTPVVINDGTILVGDDGRVYNIGFQAGDGTDSAWGVTRISNNGIEERIRRQLRREAGLTP